MGKEVLAYVRVSTEEQGDLGNGLQAQRDAILAKVVARGDTIKDWYQDIASGKSLHRRPQLAAALHALGHQQASGLVVAKLDRLARSVQDYSALLALSQKQNWSLIALDLDFDTSTPQGKMVAHIFASFAQFERELIGQRTKEGMAVVRSRGPAPGKREIGRPRLVSPAVERQIRRLHGRGRSLRHIARFLNEKGILAPTGGQWGFTTINRVVKR